MNSLPEKTDFAPLMSMMGGFSKVIVSGGTAGWGDLISGVKDGINSAINAKAKENDMENYILYLNLEKVKF